ncbi:MAG: 3D (Asp-Asp-Asp) domain-containing protein [Rubritalea sp.]|jgi:3D (Asp-Asp-Asp) domain-containing protein
MKHNFTKIGLILSGLIAITSCASSCSPTTSATTSIYKSGSVTLITGKTIGKDKHGMPTYTDKSRTRLLRATAYSHMEKEVGAPGRKNAAGTTLKYGSTRSAAADWSKLPLGTKFKVIGKPGITYVVDDYGSALAGTNTIDMFYPTLRAMHNWGTRRVIIQIIQMGSFERSAKILSGRKHAAHCREMYYAIKKKHGKSFARN